MHIVRGIPALLDKYEQISASVTDKYHSEDNVNVQWLALNSISIIPYSLSCVSIILTLSISFLTHPPILISLRNPHESVMGKK